MQRTRIANCVKLPEVVSSNRQTCYLIINGMPFHTVIRPFDRLVDLESILFRIRPVYGCTC